MGFGIKIPASVPNVAAATAKVIPTQNKQESSSATAATVAVKPESIIGNPISTVANVVNTIVPSASLPTQLLLLNAFKQAKDGNIAEATASASAAIGDKSPMSLQFLPTVMTISKENRDLALNVMLFALNKDGCSELAEALKAAAQVSEAASVTGIINMAKG